MISRRLLILCLAGMILLQAAGFILLNLPLGLLLVLPAGAAGFYGMLREKTWAEHIAFVLNLGIAAWLQFSGCPPALSLAITMLALAGWDLARLAPRLARIDPPAAAARLERRHLFRLGAALAAGCAAAAAALVVQLRLSFVASGLLGLSAILLIAFAAYALRRGQSPIADE